MTETPAFPRQEPITDPDELARWISRPGAPETLAARMGIKLLEASPHRLVGTMPVAGNKQLYGLLHGGASVVLAETLGSIGAALHAGGGHIALGVDINATHHRAVRGGIVTGVATALNLGPATASYDVAVLDEAGNRTCTARITVTPNTSQRMQRGKK
ncbi:hotdog fold thioesterase [Streptomyces sp. AV19]|uniref:hotdog fold thioesterase n=1 Tax=Streptomyces sp. AV19 TaxID=2793068 RepID=UPI0018FEF6C7|nr:hotdog fold thioesterase [Streptomyces sp. AV19]MBH1934481.1 hotdog fold thioesterase [Streptomyces sp. AV19]MDG4533273.1 hotdog fold thioesterase [Streptomyces sp. AV19]